MDTSVASVASVAPVADGERVKVIDALRGVALLGILMMNIDWFAFPPLFQEPFRRDPTKLDFWVLAVISVFFEGKMRALFGMLFGAGVVLFMGRKKELGLRKHLLFYRRMGILLLMGLFHAHVMLWHGEILYFYAVCGAIVYLFQKFNPKFLLVIVPIVGIIDWAQWQGKVHEWRDIRIAYVAADAAKGRGETLTAGQEKAITDFRELAAAVLPDHTAADEVKREMKGSYTQVRHHTDEVSWKGEGELLLPQLPDSVALMLMGVGLFRLGFFSGTWRRSTYKRIAIVGYGLGLPMAAYAFYWWITNAPTNDAYFQLLERTRYFWIDLTYPFQRMLIVLAHASMLILLFQSGIVPRVFARLAAVGQMALTNYLMQTVIATLFFYGYGLNMFARLTYSQSFLFVFAVWAVQIAWSAPWLSRFRFGPAEWLWRAGTYWARPPMRR